MFLAGQHAVSDSLRDGSEVAVRALMTETSPATQTINIGYGGAHSHHDLLPLSCFLRRWAGSLLIGLEEIGEV